MPRHARHHHPTPTNHTTHTPTPTHLAPGRHRALGELGNDNLYPAERAALAARYETTAATTRTRQQRYAPWAWTTPTPTPNPHETDI